ncbi:Benzyl alcohol O-benzoyltransferase [Hibiscus syriacus]|uniref:Benzyl alcohol O-benzoyltransferase n=1 Tax=Hibiscus syriacus TaxID=106335 RepID=A0A6A3CZ82_HIBSY|nr:benzyl alcohol O-benzoyltransferase-like [Hibiscus syriacus]KAE8734600.1 Benzyl alcohol O-benzoyltransferase [Hibiscus syriacus]
MAMEIPPTSLAFKVRRREPELVAPVKPTPRELKPLSDIDDREGHRFEYPMILLYRYNPSMKGKDPARIIRDALAKTLVFYYPFAGRLREGPNRKLSVDCTGEGVLFIEGDADVTLEEFGDELLPPFPCMDELLYDVEGSGGVLNCPLLLIQVTRLKCNSFICAIRHNHTMSDAVGWLQFMTAVGEMARGASSPTITPVWERHLLNARNPPRVTYTHHEFDQQSSDEETIQPGKMVHLSFVFGSNELSSLRRLLPSHHHQHCSTFDILTACLWQCHTKALQRDPKEHVCLICIVNARSKFNPRLPSGYYGNVTAYPATVTTAGTLCQSPLVDVIELVKRTKGKVTEEYMKSMADFLATNGRPALALNRSFLVSDVTKIDFGDIDFGWGKPVYGGQANVMDGKHLLPYKNKEGEDGIVIPLCLPAPIMERFVSELNSMLKNEKHSCNSDDIKSNL